MWALVTFAITSLLTRLASAAGGTLEIPWSTDLTGGGDGGVTLGPDGPWQAIAVRVGSVSRESIKPIEETKVGNKPLTKSFVKNNSTAFLWPSGSSITEILSIETGGNYSAKDSWTAVSNGASLGNSDSWMGSVFLNETSTGRGYYDTLAINVKSGSARRVNTSISSLTERSFRLPSGSNYTNPVGILGLGRDLHDGPWPNSSDNSWILEQLKSAGDIASNTFSLHMGSAVLEQPGSLVLGGYEKNRALGQVGTFPFWDSIPVVILMDVFFGTEEGPSAFGKDGSISIYQGLGNDTWAAQISKGYGATLGAAVAILNPSSPYMYLPLGTCEAAAKNLPVTWDAALGVYIWDIEDPRYTRIVSSSAYMGFVLADREALNITIKVPFQLLNLTLLPPLTESPTQYFPCQPWISEWGFFQLGRAFLQATFMLVDFETNRTMIAQAPGPDMAQKVLRVVEAGNQDIIETNPIDSWAQSWASTWVVLPASNTSNEGIEEQTSKTSLPVGAKAGIGVGSAVAAIAILATSSFCWWKRKQAPRPASGGHDELNNGGATGQSGPQELPPNEVPAEIGNGLPHELEAEQQNLEYQASPALNTSPQTRCYELPSEAR
ncbi:hypothetical protein DL765_002809 [Monosporascus sp. GIB2]|nr:hypothetical protein DL765_002809 [Monosporascus sp. GIB2]